MRWGSTVGCVLSVNTYIRSHQSDRINGYIGRRDRAPRRSSTNCFTAVGSDNKRIFSVSFRVPAPVSLKYGFLLFPSRIQRFSACLISYLSRMIRREPHNSRWRSTGQPKPKSVLHIILPFCGVTILSSPINNDVQNAAGPVAPTTCCIHHELRQKNKTPLR